MAKLLLALAVVLLVIICGVHSQLGCRCFNTGGQIPSKGCYYSARCGCFVCPKCNCLPGDGVIQCGRGQSCQRHPYIDHCFRCQRIVIDPVPHVRPCVFDGCHPKGALCRRGHVCLIRHRCYRCILADKSRPDEDDFKLGGEGGQGGDGDFGTGTGRDFGTDTGRGDQGDSFPTGGGGGDQ